MPYNLVPQKFALGTLRSGSATGPVVRKRKQMIAILMSEKKKAGKGMAEYAAKPRKPKSLSSMLM